MRLDILEKTFHRFKERLMQEAVPQGYWEGRLSSSPLATAVAVFALGRANKEVYQSEIEKGLNWLAENINSDGGWGDSPESKTNLSTTLLCWSAFTQAKDSDSRYFDTLKKVEAWLKARMGSLAPEDIASAVLDFYGDDKTFSAPILMMCALAGRLGPAPGCWRWVPQLPMELAILPHRLFKWLRLNVVSYAIPALIAIGLARHRRAPQKGSIMTPLRNLVTHRCMNILETIQPENGGYLEAIPLTSFVVMSLTASDFREHPVVKRGIRFLEHCRRSDGSWPIDTNLATWVTTLSVNALCNGQTDPCLPYWQRESIRAWLLNQQHIQEHVFTHAAPGGWSWTDRPGGVPDADDTSGVLLALHHLGPIDHKTRQAASRGIQWLLDLQNPDGGIPTFCRGWGKLPFDRSCPDITAHALRTFAAWRDDLPRTMQSKIDVTIHKGIAYLKGHMTEDGAWIPLWFGNQSAAHQENPTYGTAQVILSLLEQKLQFRSGVDALLKKGCAWLRANQNLDGGWGGTRGLPSTIEETALALGALSSQGHEEAIRRGIQWLIQHTNKDGDLRAAPIGLYFASLWYDEKLYPIIFTVSALRRILESVERKKHKPSFPTVGNENPEELPLHSIPPFSMEK